jgi:hypothetical protein
VYVNGVRKVVGVDSAGSAIRRPGRIGIRGDNCNFKIDNFAVNALRVGSTLRAAQWEETAEKIDAVADLRETRVYPNPWRSDQHGAFPVTFDHLSEQADIRIFSLSGQIVREISTASGAATWDLMNASGDHVASGLYLYLVTNNRGDRFRGKLAIIR